MAGPVRRLVTPKHEGREPCALPGSWQTPNAEFFASLPRDPDALYERLRADIGDRGEDPT